MSIKRTIITAATVVVAVAMVASVAGAQTPTIDQLMAQIAALQSQLQGLSSTPAASGTGLCTGVTFTRNLTVGSTGSDVKCLQQILSVTPTSGFFGPKTLAAVKAYQTAQGLTAANQVGPMTRAKLNASISGGTVVLPPVGQTGSVSAMLANDNPAAGALVNKQARAGLLSINFVGTGTVTSVTLQRSGISTSSTLSNVYLFDGATRLTSGYSFNTNGQLVMNGLNIAVNGQHEISVLGDVATGASTDASSVRVTLVGYTANGSSLSANVMGNSQTIVAGSAATAVFPNGLVAAPTATTINAGSVNQTLWSQSLTVSTRAILLYGMTVKQIGSAPSNTLSNLGLYVDGTLAATTAINASNQFVFTISNPVTLATGSHLLEVHGDVVAGATRTFTMYLEQGSDVALKDSQLGIYISPTETNSVNAVSNIVSGLITVGGVVSGQANVIVNQDTAFNNTTTLVGGATNTTLASFKFTAYGEDTNVTSLTFTPSISGSDGTNALDTLANVGLYVNGGQIGSSKVAKNGTAFSFTSLGSQIQIPVGTTVTVSIKGDVVSDSTNTVTAGASKNFASGTIEFDVASGATQGVSSGSTSTSGFSQSGQSLTVSSTNVTMAASTGFGTTATVAPNSTAELARWTLATGSAEGINVSSVVVTFPTADVGTGTNAVYNNDLTNIVLKVNGAVVSNTVGNPVVGSNSFPLSNVNVPVNGSIEFELFGQVGGSATAYHIIPRINVFYRGLTSNLSTDYITVNSGTGVAGANTAVGAAAIASTGVTTSTALTAQYVTGNGTASPLPIVTYNVKATANVGGANIQTMTFTNPSADGTITSVTVGGVTRPMVSNTVTVTLPGSGIAVPANASGVSIPVTVGLSCIGSGCSATANTGVSLALTKITYYNGSAVVCDGATCASAGTNDTAALTAASATPVSYLVSSVPTVSMATTSSTGLVLGAQQIGTFTVSAGSTGDIKIRAIPFTITVGGTTASVTSNTITLYDQNGNTLDNPAVNAGQVGGSGTISGTFTFPSTQYSVPANTSKTFTVYATLGGTLGAVNSSNVTFTISPKASFLWDDVTGGVTSATGTYIYGYPNGTQTKSN